MFHLIALHSCSRWNW